MRFAIAFLFILLGQIAAKAQAKESAIQAIFLCSLMKYLDWNGSEKKDFVIRVIGNDEVFEELTKTSKARKLNDRNIIVEKMTFSDALGNCDVVFLATVNANQLEKFVAKTGNEPVLIISNKDGYLEKGADINLIEKDGKLAFQLNKASIEKKGIKIAGSLMTMAQKAI
jgi:hypothetical protein